MQSRCAQRADDVGGSLRKALKARTRCFLACVSKTFGGGPEERFGARGEDFAMISFAFDDWVADGAIEYSQQVASSSRDLSCVEHLIQHAVICVSEAFADETDAAGGITLFHGTR